MLGLFVRSIRRRSEFRDPKKYKVTYVNRFTVLGQQSGPGYYIVNPDFDTIGPIITQGDAEKLLFSALEEVRGKPFSDDEKEKARAVWNKK